MNNGGLHFRMIGRYRATALVLFGAALGLSAGAELELPATAPAQGPRVRVVAELASPKIEAGAPVDVTLHVVNETGRDLDFTESTPDFDSLVRVLDHNAKDVPRTSYYSFAQAAGTRQSRAPLRLHPGEQATYVLRVNRLCDMTVGGKYTIMTAFLLLRQGEVRPQQIAANPVTVEILIPEVVAKPGKVSSTQPATREAGSR